MKIKELKKFGFNLCKTNNKYNYKDGIAKRKIIYYDLYYEHTFCGNVYKKGMNTWYVPTIIPNTDITFKRKSIKSREQLFNLINTYYEIGDTRNIMYCTSINEDYQRWCFIDKIINKYGFTRPSWKDNYGGNNIEASWCKVIGNEKVYINLYRGECKLTSSFSCNFYLEETFIMWNKEDTLQKISNLISLPLLKNIVPGIELLMQIPSLKDSNIKKYILSDFFPNKEKPLYEQLTDIRNELDNIINKINENKQYDKKRNKHIQ